MKHQQSIPLEQARLFFLTLLLAMFITAACGSGGGGNGGGGGNSTLSANISSPSGALIVYAYDPIAFTGSASGGSGGYTYAWDFDSTDVGGGPSASSIQSPTKVFQNAGTYVVQLTVSDGAGSAASTQTVTVLPENDPDRITYRIDGGTEVVATEATRTITATLDPQGALDRTTIRLAENGTDIGLGIRLVPSNDALPLTYTTHSSTAGPIVSVFTESAGGGGVPDYFLQAACSDSDTKQVTLTRYGRRIAGMFALRLYKYNSGVCDPNDHIEIEGTFNVARSEFNLTGGATPIPTLTPDAVDDYVYRMDEDSSDTAGSESGGATIEAVYNTTTLETTVQIIQADGSVLSFSFQGNTTGTYLFSTRMLTDASYAPADATDGVPAYLPNDGTNAVSKCGTAMVNISVYGTTVGSQVVGTIALEGFQYPGAPTHTIDCGERHMLYGAFEATRLADDTALTEP